VSTKGGGTAEKTVQETPEQMFRRVAEAVAAPDENPAEAEEQFYELMTTQRFLPNSPTIMNAGATGTCSACFTFVPEDDLDSILDIGKLAGRVLKYGGGVGYGLSRLRARGAPVTGTGGTARGPLAALPYYQSIAAFVEQGGKRDGAQMAILSCDHPDIGAFIRLKEENPKQFNTFNISVAATDEWMKTEIERGPGYGFLWGMACAAWKCGDPGLYFVDQANRDNPTPHLGSLESTNPCGEVPLLPFEACNLGSMNLAKYYNPPEGRCAWEELERDVKVAIRFLDNVVTINQFPDERITAAVQATRKIGLGVMGWADLLALCHISYDSKLALDSANQISTLMRKWADEESYKLAQLRGPYPAWNTTQNGPYRNATRLCIAPTGSIAILAGCSSGIEPHYMMEYDRFMGDGTKLHVIEPVLERLNGFRPKVAHDISAEWHLKHQAAWQQHVDLAVSKTINLPSSSTPQDIYDAYVMAWEMGCKGVTVYRDGSYEGGEQVLKASEQIDPPIQVSIHLDKEPSPELAEALGNVAGAAARMLKGAQRKKLPTIRESVTHAFRVGDEKGYLTVGLYADGSPGELFITLNRQGASVRAWSDITATMVSMLLQYGCPLASITQKLRSTRFDPAGVTGYADIPLATSIADYVGHFLEKRFLNIEAPAITGEPCPDCGEPLIHQSGCARCLGCGWERCG